MGAFCVFGFVFFFEKGAFEKLQGDYTGDCACSVAQGCPTL